MHSKNRSPFYILILCNIDTRDSGKNAGRINFYEQINKIYEESDKCCVRFL